jgi:hypothetical protein
MPGPVKVERKSSVHSCHEDDAALALELRIQPHQNFTGSPFLLVACFTDGSHRFGKHFAFNVVLALDEAETIVKNITVHATSCTISSW